MCLECRENRAFCASRPGRCRGRPARAESPADTRAGLGDGSGIRGERRPPCERPTLRATTPCARPLWGGDGARRSWHGRRFSRAIGCEDGDARARRPAPRSVARGGDAGRRRVASAREQPSGRPRLVASRLPERIGDRRPRIGRLRAAAGGGHASRRRLARAASWAPWARGGARGGARSIGGCRSSRDGAVGV
jgi:hypothetical protein